MKWRNARNQRHANRNEQSLWLGPQWTGVAMEKPSKFEDRSIETFQTEIKEKINNTNDNNNHHNNYYYKTKHPRTVKTFKVFLSYM